MERKFLKGEKVRVIDAYASHRAKNGDIVEVVECAGGYTRFLANNGDKLTWATHRFAPLNEARPFQVGDRVKVIEAYDNGLYGLNFGLEGTIVDIDPADGHIKIDSLPNYHWRPSRFELVQPPAVHVFQVGDKVRVVKKHVQPHFDWPNGMDKFINNGEIYIIKEASYLPTFLLDTGEFYWFLPESLELVKEEAKPVKQAAKAKPKKVRKPKKLPKKSIRAALLKAVKKGDISGICAFAMEAEDHKIYFENYSPCHAALNRLAPQNHKVVELAYSIVYEHTRVIPQSKDVKLRHKRYVQYILNESPWAVCFKTKLSSVALRYDILMDVTKNRNWIAGACIALREGSEYYDERLPMFELILKKGYSGNTAFLMSTAYMLRDGEIRKRGMGGGHSVLYGEMDSKELFEFFRNGYTKGKDMPPFSESHGSYKVFESIAKSHGASSFSSWIDHNTNYTVQGEGFKVKRTLTEKDLLVVADKIEAILKEQK